MNNGKVIFMLVVLLIVLIYNFILFSYSKYSFMESFVAFKIENATDTNNFSINEGNMSVDNLNNSIEENSEEEGIIDIVEVKH